MHPQCNLYRVNCVSDIFQTLGSWSNVLPRFVAAHDWNVTVIYASETSASSAVVAAGSRVGSILMRAAVALSVRWLPNQSGHGRITKYTRRRCGHYYTTSPTS